MTRTQKIFFAMLVAFFIFCGLTQAAFASKKVGTLKNVKGIVEYEAATGASAGKAREGQDVYEKDKIKTKIGASCEIHFLKGATVKLSQNSVVQVAVARTLKKQEVGKKSDAVSDVVLLLGRTFSKVKKSVAKDAGFEISTPTTIAGVRGTLFSVDVDEAGKTTVSCKEGKVEVFGQNESVTISGNQQTEILPELPEPKAPEPLSEKEGSAWEKEKDFSESKEEGKGEKLLGEKEVTASTKADVNEKSPVVDIVPFGETQTGDVGEDVSAKLEETISGGTTPVVEEPVTATSETAVTEDTSGGTQTEDLGQDVSTQLEEDITQTTTPVEEPTATIIINVTGP